MTMKNLLLPSVLILLLTSCFTTNNSYYVDPKSGKIGRYNKPTGELIEPGDTGFTGKSTK